jgi:hypothetical protein
MDKKAKSLSEIIKLIKGQFESLNDVDNVQNLWFRAEKLFISYTEKSISDVDISKTDSYTPLLPNAYRILGRVEESDYNDVNNEAKAIEGNFKAEFSRHSKMFLNQNRIADNKWNNYFLMQHYGLKTRLLDWTESALVAIYFAVKDDLKNNDSKIWILNPHRLNKSTYKVFGVSSCDSAPICFPQSSSFEKKKLIDNVGTFNLNELERKYLEMDFDSDEKSYPLAIYPYLFDERMKVQKACFTIFGNQINGLLNNPDKDNFLQSIIIDGNMKCEIKKELRWLGISEESVYPGIESQCKDIQEKYKISILKKL